MLCTFYVTAARTRSFSTEEIKLHIRGARRTLLAAEAGLQHAATSRTATIENFFMVKPARSDRVLQRLYLATSLLHLPV